MSYINRARQIQRSLGTRTAAGYLRNRGYSMLGARYILCIYKPFNERSK